MKKRTDPKTKKASTRRLKVKKEILRNLSPADLNLVAGGIHCPWSVPPPGGGGRSCDC
ncbi:MAG TPA: hypothetical protein VMZ28_06005 [Kofleriaceae bacterium]|nr:hypothetical protein [Kofleriaceae bacterium]